MNPLQVLRRLVFDSLAFLAAAAPGQRTGIGSPGAAPTLAAAPVDGTRVPSRSTARVRRSLRFSTAEGIIAEAFASFAGGAVLTGWGMHLGCTPLVLGMLGALPFLAQFAQLPAAWLTSRFGRRRVCIVSVCASREVLLPLAALPFLPWSLAAKQQVLIGVAMVSSILAVVGNNAWVAWMGELVPAAIRGRYFGKRSAFCTLGGTLASLLAGVALDGSRTRAHSGTALAALALTACLVGVITTVLMCQQHDPGVPEESLDLRAAFTPFRHRPARRFLTYLVTWNAAVGLSAAYYGVHMLSWLRMGFVLMAVHGALTASVRMLSAPLWGRALDRFGARPVLLACSFGIVAVPLVWLFPRAGMLWPLAFDILLSGSLWSGHAVASFALPLSVAPRSGRPLFLAAFATAGGLAQGLFTYVGGAFMSHLPATFSVASHEMVAFHVLVVASSAARLVAAVVGLRIVEEGSRPLHELVESGLSEANELGAKVLRLRPPLPKRRRVV